MKGFVYRIHRSLSARLSLWVVLFAAAIFLTTFSMIFSETHTVVREEVWAKSMQMLESTVLCIDNTLERVEVASNNMIRVIEENLDDPDMMFDLSKQVLVSNPVLSGCSISFEPYYYKEKGRYFSAYSYNNGDSIQTENEGNDGYQYHYMDWYLIPKLLNRPYWIEPFLEDEEVGIVVKDIFTTYSRPIHDKEGKVVGTFSLDICLDWFSSTVSEAKPYPHSYSILLGKDGTYLVHPDSTKLFYETIYTPTLEKPDSALTALGEAMIAGETGHRMMMMDGEMCHVFFKPFMNLGWSVAIVCPERDILEGYTRPRNQMLCIAFIGLVVLLLSCRMFVKQRLKPLKTLAESTRDIAEGHFYGNVPESNRQDEIGQLQRSFKSMQQSLVTHIEEMRLRTKTLEERNADLLEAYEHAKEDERTKTAVLHHMPEKIAAPVGDLSALAHDVARQHRQMTDDELGKTVEKIQEDAYQVTILLDELLAVAEQEAPRDDVKPDDNAI